MTIEVDVVLLVLVIFLAAWAAGGIGYLIGWSRGFDHVIKTLRRDR